jgi:hypothetical protein
MGRKQAVEHVPGLMTGSSAAASPLIRPRGVGGLVGLVGMAPRRPATAYEAAALCALRRQVLDGVVRCCG